MAEAGTITTGEDFPQLCETCLGPNPYVRMVKLRFGEKMCKISNLPYQGFRWKAGAGGRMKETIISYAVARDRDICQTCLNDMKYGLPVGVRDKLLAQAARQNGSIATSEVGLRYQFQAGAAGGGGGGASTSMLALTDVARQQATLQIDVFAKARAEIEARSKTAFRNLPKLCSFWVAGACTRVVRKVCQFRPCCGQFVFPEIASNREMHAALVDKLERLGALEVMASLDNETRVALKSSGAGVNHDEAIRKRVMGQDDLANKYLGQIKHKNPDLTPPADESITTLWVGRVEDSVGEADIRDAVYPFLPAGVSAQQVDVHVLRPAKCAFLQFASRDVAEAVAAKVQRKLVVAGAVCPFDWAKPRAEAGSGGPTKRARTAGEMLPPPGLESAPVNAYSLPGLAAPIVAVSAASPRAAAQHQQQHQPPPPPPPPPPPLPQAAEEERDAKAPRIEG